MDEKDKKEVNDALLSMFKEDNFCFRFTGSESIVSGTCTLVESRSHSGRWNIEIQTEGYVRAKKRLNGPIPWEIIRDEDLLPIRAIMALRKHHVDTWEELAYLSKGDLAMWKNVGAKTVEAIAQFARDHGMDLARPEEKFI